MKENKEKTTAPTQTNLADRYPIPALVRSTNSYVLRAEHFAPRSFQASTTTQPGSSLPEPLDLEPTGPTK